MPKPENFDKLTPDQKRQARLEAWINHEGLEFTNPEVEKGYRERAQMFADAFLMKKPKRVPVRMILLPWSGSSGSKTRRPPMSV